MLKKLLLTISALCAIQFSHAQNSQDLNDPILDPRSVIPSSPTVSNLIDFATIPVNYYTGQPNITVPLYSKKIHKDLNLNLQLGYSSNGVKINSRSGWAGTGWSLSGLGVISKTVRGIPDEMFSSTGVGLWHVPIEEPFDLQQQWRVYGENGTKGDSQYDLFNAVYPGGSVEFILISKGDTLIPKIINSSEQVRVDVDFTFTANPNYSNKDTCISVGKHWVESYKYRKRTGYNEYVTVPAHCNDGEIIELDRFTIVDALGKRYVFDKYESSTSTPITGTIQQGSGEVGSIDVGQNANFYTSRSAWHLTSIYSGPSDLSKLIEIEYGSHYLETYNSSVSYKENVIDMSSTALSYDQLEYDYNKRILKPYREVSYFVNSTNSTYPSKIIFRDSTYLQIDHDLTNWHPETNGVILRSIKQYDRANNLVSKKVLKHDITQNNNRLWLIGLDEVNQNQSDIQSYVFIYNQNDLLPAFDSPKDIWGFIHQGDRSLIGKDTDPIQTGLLSSIVYPTGGKKEFTWEQHRFSYAGNGQFDPQTQTNENPNNYSEQWQDIQADSTFQAIGTPTLYSQNVTIPEHINARISLIYLQNTSQNPNADSLDYFNSYVRIEDSNGTIVFNGQITDLITYSSLAIPQLSAGMNTISLNTVNSSSYDLSFKIRVSYQVERTSTNNNSEGTEKWIYGGGPRIKEIMFTDHKNTERKWTYSYDDINNSGFSSGVIDGKFESYIPNYSLSVNRYLLLTAASMAQRTVYYDVKADQANVKMTNGSYVGYKNVRVSEPGKGFTEYRFSSPYSHTSNDEEFSYPFHQNNNVDAYRGSLTNELHYQQYLINDTTYLYDGGGNIIPDQFSVDQVSKYFVKSAISYEYDFQMDSILNSYYVASSNTCHPMQFYNSFQSDTSATMMTNCPPGYQGAPNCDAFTISSCGTTFYTDSSAHINFWKKLTRKTTRNFEYPNDLLSQKTNSIIEDYEYNPFNRLLSHKTTTQRENGNVKVEESDYYYSSGPYPSNIFTSLEQSHLDSNKNYNRINDLIFVSATEKIKNDNSVLLSSKAKGQKKLTYDIPHNDMYELSDAYSRTSEGVTFRKDIGILKVDDYGNALEFLTSDGVYHVHLYGYNGSVLIASIENTSYNQAISGVNLVDLNPNRTSGGTNSIDSALAIIRSNLNSDKVLMTTYHYDDQMNLERIVDPNGFATTYRYDAFGRLTAIVDKDGNMVEEVKYGYRN